ncbi:hypothetical protein K449DRAFT_465938 [Hypoxylon sp. EC38]|nr:hypothetical protein K449DRAFT_465938 [Hypoxylon sp. EC38]
MFRQPPNFLVTRSQGILHIMISCYMYIEAHVESKSERRLQIDSGEFECLFNRSPARNYREYSTYRTNNPKEGLESTTPTISNVINTAIVVSQIFNGYINKLVSPNRLLQNILLEDSFACQELDSQSTNEREAEDIIPDVTSTTLT